MTHQQQVIYVKTVKGSNPDLFSGKRVLEFGSFNVNGTARDFFDAPAEYVGVDWREGPCVDHVSLFHEFEWPTKFDILISVNTLEHDPFWKDSLAAGVRHLADGGAVLVVCATGKTSPHELAASPRGGYYYNLGAEEFDAQMAGLGVVGVSEVRENALNADLCFFGHRARGGGAA